MFSCSVITFFQGKLLSWLLAAEAALPVSDFVYIKWEAFTGCSDGNVSACNAGDRVQSLDWEDPLENGSPLQYSCLENSTDWEAWQAIVHGVAKSRTWLSDYTHVHKIACSLLCLFSYTLHYIMTFFRVVVFRRMLVTFITAQDPTVNTYHIYLFILRLMEVW